MATCVHREAAATGDSLFVPSGRLHALGRGLLIYEIQQNSDTTYRVFDWNRVGLDGKPRQLHVAESMQCIDFADVQPGLHHGAGVLADCEFFTLTRARTGHPASRDRARLIVPITDVRWAGTTLPPGQLTLAPAGIADQQPVGEWLEVELR